MSNTGEERSRSLADDDFTEVREGSGVIRVNSTTRVIHLAAVLPVTRPEKNITLPLESRVYYIAGGYLGLRHFNERSNEIIPNLSEMLQGCDIQMTIEYRDTQYSRIEGARQLQNILQQWPHHSLSNPFPAALVGAGRSGVTETLSILSGAYQLPQLSPHSSAASLDDKARFPFFARTTPSNAADGKAVVDYLRHLEVSHVGVIYILDTNGNQYHKAILEEAKEQGISVTSVPYQHNTGDENMRQALLRLKQSKVRYIFGVIEPSTWKGFISLAVEVGIIGRPDYFWIFHSGMVGLVPEELDKTLDYDIAHAIHGSAVLLKDFPSNEMLDAKLANLETDIELKNEFTSQFVSPDIFEGFDFRYPGPNYPQYINYDSIIALGLAACAIDNDFFSGLELYQSLLKTEFTGASDYVSFVQETGSRKTVPFRVDNILLSDNNSSYGFLQIPTAKISVHGVEKVKGFIYWNNSTTAPLSLPPGESNLNLIPTSLRSLGLILCGISMLGSIGWSIWTWHYRMSAAVQASQPFFLCQLCLGTLIMASSIIPMSLQEPISQKGLDIACMSANWLLIIGYVISFAALFCKSWRINKLFQSGRCFQRVKVRVVDAIFALVILILTNVILLTVWTILSPLKWVRVDVANYDEFGRPRESYGQCRGDGSVTFIAIVVSIAVVNVLALVFTNFQCYKTRLLPTAFNESYYIAATNVSILEAMILGVPFLTVANENPSSSFIVKAILITVMCWTILLLLFVPKHLQRNEQEFWEKQGRSASQFFLNSSNTFNTPQETILGDNSPNEIGPNGGSDPQGSYGMRVTRLDGYYVQTASRNFRGR